MSMTLVALNATKHSGGDDQAEVEYELTFTGAFTVPEALALSGVPAQGAQYGSTGLYCSGRNVDMDTPASGALPGSAKVKITYTLRTNTYEDLGIAPLDRPAQIDWGGPEQTEVRKYDSLGNPLRNSAGQFFVDLPEFYIRGGGCTITQNVSSNPADDCVLYSFTTNDTDWNGVGAGNALIGKITSSKQTERFNGADYTYYVRTVPISFRRDGWNWHTFDIGSMEIDEDSNVVQALDENNVPITVLLDGSGGRLSDQTGDPTPWPDEDGFVIYEAADFSGLGLPNPFA